MFGLSKKRRVAEALRRGTKAILIGGFFHVEHAEEFHLSEEASAWLYTEAIAHQTYVLMVTFNNTLAKRYRWATPAFAIKAVSGAMADFEMEQGLVPGGISSFALRRCAEMDALSPEERTSGIHFSQSAAKIAELDPAADQRAIVERLSSVARTYFDNILSMFQD